MEEQASSVPDNFLCYLMGHFRYPPNAQSSPSSCTQCACGVMSAAM